MDFVAIDVELANPNMSSICQVGIAKYSNGVLIDEWCQLVDPEEYFDPYTCYVHGITKDDVRDLPKFPEIASRLRDYLSNSVCVSHTPFDKVALSSACSKYNIASLGGVWLDSARVTRRAWKQFARKGYGLRSICNYLNYEFKHHDALEDAKAAGYVLLTAIEQTDINLNNWFIRINQPIDPSASSKTASVKREGDPDGELYGEVLCFTGALEISRKEAADLASNAGCEVTANVTKKTTILVVGDQDVTRLAGKNKSSKHRKAEEQIAKGQEIRIINETDFKKLIEPSN